MSSYDLDPIPTLTLTSEERIRAYVNPTRMTILALLAKEKHSASGIARQLGVHPANLTHHFKILEKAGLIELVEKRETGKNLEKYYRAKAYHFVVSSSEPPANQKVLALSILRDNLTSALHTLDDPADERLVLGSLKTVRLHSEDVETFAQKLLDLLDEFEGRAAETGDFYSLNVSLYPTEAGNSPPQRITIRTEDNS
ncbi:MAG: helix-turn-helix transcriptional regulator [Anaerolineae bacterium]|nr:helix-turn-helix transcriptional regulator [Anaerolineae bacterium]